MNEDDKRQQEFSRRRKAKLKQGWDECSATGAGHSPEWGPQPDGNVYCQYCGAEILPEELADDR